MMKGDKDPPAKYIFPSENQQFLLVLNCEILKASCKQRHFSGSSHYLIITEMRCRIRLIELEMGLQAFLDCILFKDETLETRGEQGLVLGHMLWWTNLGLDTRYSEQTFSFCLIYFLIIFSISFLFFRCISFFRINI